MIKLKLSIISFLIIFCLLGCSYFATFSPPVMQETKIILKENDFSINKTNLTGSASVAFLFGIIPLGDERLYSRALANLYIGVEKDIIGTSSQLLNWSVDDMKFNYLFFTLNKVVFRADLMTFTK